MSYIWAVSDIPENNEEATKQYSSELRSIYFAFFIPSLLP